MNKIEQLHSDAIKQSFKWIAWDLIDSNLSTAASKSAEITQQIAIEYSTWLMKWCEYNKYRKLIDGVKPYGIGEFISDNDMFQEFLKTKQPNTL